MAIFNIPVSWEVYGSIEIEAESIEEAVNTFADISKIYNLSANSNIPIEGDEMSIIGYEIDALKF